MPFAVLSTASLEVTRKNAVFSSSAFDGGRIGVVAMNVKEVRRVNLRRLAKSLGGLSALAERLDKSQAQVSHMIGKNPIKNIGDKIAAQVECVFHKPVGWLDYPQLEGMENLPEGTLRSGLSGDMIFCQKLPVIDWDDLAYLDRLREGYFPEVQTFVQVMLPVSVYAFVLCLEGDRLRLLQDLGVNQKGFMLVEPEAVAKDGDLLVVSLGQGIGASLQQWVVKSDGIYFRAVNRAVKGKPYRVKVSPKAQIHGVVKQVWMNV